MVHRESLHWSTPQSNRFRGFPSVMPLQSPGQLTAVSPSPDSHTPFGHEAPGEVCLQSTKQLEQVSTASQMPFPHCNVGELVGADVGVLVGKGVVGVLVGAEVGVFVGGGVVGGKVGAAVTPASCMVTSAIHGLLDESIELAVRTKSFPVPAQFEYV